MSKRRSKSEPIPAVGTRVKLLLGIDWVEAIVIEDRGNLAVGRRRLLRVRLEIPHTGEPLEMEIPAADVKVAA